MFPHPFGLSFIRILNSCYVGIVESGLVTRWDLYLFINWLDLLGFRTLGLVVSILSIVLTW